MTCLHNTQNASKLFTSSEIVGIRVISSCFFFRKMFKRKNPLTSKNKLTKRKQANKKPKAAFFLCAQKLLMG